MADWLTPERWQEFEPLLDMALEQEEGTRAAYLESVAQRDPALGAELNLLVRDAARITELPLLDRSAGEAFASLLRDDSAIVARIFADELADRYTILKRIGAGGMATIYLARDVRHDRDVAIKILHPDVKTTSGSARFQREIRTTARLQHPHLLPLLDSGEAGGQLFYVMPYVAGETLRARLNREQRLPVPDALRIAREVAGALDSAHKTGAVHRDIKPENILLHEGQAIVADWGIALPTSGTERQPLTADGFRLGTPQYMSPEQAIGDRALDARSDVHSLGSVLHEMLTGAPPFTGDSPQEVVERVKTALPAPLRTVRGGVPVQVELAVLKALAKRPADRFSSAAEFAAALGDPDADPPASGAPGALIVALCVMVALLAIALVLALLRRTA